MKADDTDNSTDEVGELGEGYGQVFVIKGSNDILRDAGRSSCLPWTTLHRTKAMSPPLSTKAP